MCPVRGKVAVVVAAAALTAAVLPYAGADPLQPPTSKLTVWLLERTSKTPAPIKLDIRYTPTDDWGAIVLAGVRTKGRQQQLTDGKDAFYIETRRGGFYPVAAKDGVQQLPSCPASVLCSSPAIPGDYVDAIYTPNATGLKYYLYLKDVNATFTVNSGWRRREVKGAALLQFRDTGTAVRVSAYNRQYMVEDFHGVSAPRVNRPSLAFASIPCWIYPMPGGDGEASLTSNGKVSGQWRVMDCDTYTWGALGASNVPTVWRNDGVSLGWSGGYVMRLVVAVLPPL